MASLSSLAPASRHSHFGDQVPLVRHKKTDVRWIHKVRAYSQILRKLLLPFPLVRRLQEARAGLEEAFAALLGLGVVLFLLRLQVGEVRQAIRAANRLQVELNVVLLLFIE